MSDLLINGRVLDTTGYRVISTFNGATGTLVVMRPLEGGKDETRFVPYAVRGADELCCGTPEDTQ